MPDSVRKEKVSRTSKNENIRGVPWAGVRVRAAGERLLLAGAGLQRASPAQRPAGPAAWSQVARPMEKRREKKRMDMDREQFALSCGILRKHHGAKRNGAAALRFIKLLQAQPGR